MRYPAFAASCSAVSDPPVWTLRQSTRFLFRDSSKQRRYTLSLNEGSLKELILIPSPTPGLDLEATMLLAHSVNSFSSRPPFRNRQCLRINCQAKARINFLLPSAMSLPPILVRVKPRSSFPTETAQLQLPTAWYVVEAGEIFRKIVSRLPAGARNASAWQSATPSRSSSNRLSMYGRSSIPSEFSHIRKARSSRVSSSSSAISSTTSGSSGASNPGYSLNSVATKVKLSLALGRAKMSSGCMYDLQPMLSVTAITLLARVAGSVARACCKLGTCWALSWRSRIR
mmetsp:Transcript_16721/g.42535  ORF Transcript_16721/g.42535 Transcript_16721/m.42535 type:complete len:285 (-) Transcript_16721:780-1634(-)